MAVETASGATKRIADRVICVHCWLQFELDASTLLSAWFVLPLIAKEFLHCIGSDGFVLRRGVGEGQLEVVRPMQMASEIRGERMVADPSTNTIQPQ
jgi:hypothetical protein